MSWDSVLDLTAAQLHMVMEAVQRGVARTSLDRLHSTAFGGGAVYHGKDGHREYTQRVHKLEEDLTSLSEPWSATRT
jgi:hypothetical protein